MGFYRCSKSSWKVGAETSLLCVNGNADTVIPFSLFGLDIKQIKCKCKCVTDPGSISFATAAAALFQNSTHTWTRTHLPLPQCACFLHWATMHYWWSLINIENKCELSAWKTETLEQTFCIRKTGVCISGVSGPGLSQMVGSLYISKGISIITETSKKTEKSSWWVWRISTLGFHVGHAPTELAPSIFFADCFRTWLACTV